MFAKPTAVQTAIEVGLPDHVAQADDIPWVPQGEGVWFKPLRFDLTTGFWVNLLKVTKGGKVNRHRHTGQVTGYVLQGGWHYAERTWVAKPGSMVWEPPGDIHTLIVHEGAEMITLFSIQGAIQYLDDADNVIYQDDIFTKIEKYKKCCADLGIKETELYF